MTWEMDLKVIRKAAEKKKAIAIAKKLLKKKTLTIAEIAEATDLTVEEVSALA
jgi:predicted transposase YdaD